MGLDITAYSRMTRVGCAEDDCYPAPHVRVYINPDFPTRADDLQDGCYTFDEEFDFRAGSYSGYNNWRDALARFAGYESARACFDGSHDADPFGALICFSDCEGAIGAATSAKLAADFAAFQDKADASDDDWFREKYADWRKAFEMAADGGAVCFH